MHKPFLPTQQAHVQKETTLINEALTYLHVIFSGILKHYAKIFELDGISRSVSTKFE